MRSEMLNNQTGQGLAEYALIIVFIVIVVVAILGLFGTALGNTFSQIQNDLPFG